MSRNCLELESLDPEKTNISSWNYSQLAQKLQPKWISHVFLQIWEDKSLDLTAKLRALGEVESSWPFPARVLYHQWKYQFDGRNQIVDIFAKESTHVKSIVDCILHSSGDNLEVMSEKLCALRAVFCNKASLQQWLKAECQIISYDAVIFNCLVLKKKLRFKMEHCNQEQPKKDVTYEMDVELHPSFALDIFLCLITGENDYGESDLPFDIYDRSIEIGENNNSLSLTFKPVKMSQKKVKELFDSCTSECNKSSVSISACKWSDNFRLHLNFYHNNPQSHKHKGIEVGRVVRSNIEKKRLNSGYLIFTKIEVVD